MTSASTVTLADLLPQLNDADLSTLTYLIEQAEGRQEDQGSYLRGRPDQAATQIKAAAWQREKSRRVALSSPVFTRRVTLLAGAK